MTNEHVYLPHALHGSASLRPYGIEYLRRKTQRESCWQSNVKDRAGADTLSIWLNGSAKHSKASASVSRRSGFYETLCNTGTSCGWHSRLQASGFCARVQHARAATGSRRSEACLRCPINLTGGWSSFESRRHASCCLRDSLCVGAATFSPQGRRHSPYRACYRA